MMSALAPITSALPPIADIHLHLGCPKSGHRLSKARPITYAASRTQASMTALFWRGGLSGSNGCLLADFAQDFVEETKRFPHFGPVALTMPFIVQLLALA